MRSTFKFKQFHIVQSNDAMKVGTDGVLLAAWTQATPKHQSFLDIGTGTGVIALMLAQRFPLSRIDAVEQSEKAFLLAQENFNSSPWSSKLKAYHQTIQSYSKNTATRYDCIVSNPPFFTQGTPSSNKAKSTSRHTILLPFEDLLDSVAHLLTENGCFSVVLPYQEGLAFKEKAIEYQLNCIRQTNVYPKLGKPVERLLLAFSKTKAPYTEDDLVIETDQRHIYTPEYIELTKAFYLKM